MSKQKVSFWIEEGEVGLLKGKYNTDNLSEAIRLAIMQSLATEDLEKVKTLFPYIGKKPPRIGREVVNAFEQSEELLQNGMNNGNYVVKIKGKMLLL